MNARKKSTLIFLCKVAFSAFLITLLIRYLGAQSVRNIASKANIPLLAFGCVCAIGQMALTTLKWRLLLNKQGVTVKFGALFEMQLTGQFVNLFMPSVLGGDAYRAGRLRSHTGSIGTALPSVIVDRGTGLLALLIIGLLALTHMFARQFFWLVVLATCALIVIGYLLTIGPIARLLHQSEKIDKWHIFSTGKLITDALKPSRSLLQVALISLFFQFNVVWITGVYAMAIGLSVNLWQLLIAVPAVNLVEMIPVSISGIGVREASFSVLFAKMDLSAADGLALGLTVSVMRYVTGLICGAALLLPSITTRRS